MQVCSNQTNHLGLVWKPFIKSATQNPQNSIILITHFAWWRFYTGWFLKYFTNRENKSFINEKLDELLLLVHVSVIVVEGLCVVHTVYLLTSSGVSWAMIFSLISVTGYSLFNHDLWRPTKGDSVPFTPAWIVHLSTYHFQVGLSELSKLATISQLICHFSTFLF